MADIELKKLRDFDSLTISETDKREARKKYSAFQRQVRENAKLKKCIICGKDCSSFCNSHTIPQFVLKKIAKNGELVTGMSLLKNPLLDREVGIKKTITFNIICNDCDNTLFQEYEDSNAYNKKISMQMIQKIALKNHLRMLAKRLQEIENHKMLFDSMIDNYGLEFDEENMVDIQTFIEHTKVDSIDIIDFTKEIENNLNGKTKYYVIDEIDLNYVVPIAFQGTLNLVSGFNGELINDIYNYNQKYKLLDLQVVIFPLENKTKIVLFKEDGVDKLKYFYKEYKKLTLNERLYVINYILLLYTEDYAIDPEFLEKNNINEETYNLIKTTSISMSAEGLIMTKEEYKKKAIKLVCDTHKLEKSGNIFNFLIDRNH